MDRRQIEYFLAKDWDRYWNEDQPTVRPPADNASQLTDLLLEIGVLGSRPHNRLDVPDLFLAGLGLTRKGGVRRR